MDTNVQPILNAPKSPSGSNSKLNKRLGLLVFAIPCSVSILPQFSFQRGDVILPNLILLFTALSEMSWTQKLKLALARGDYSTTDTIFKKLGLPVSALDNDTNEPIIYIAIEYYQNELLQKLLHTEELILMMQHGSNTNNILTTAIKHSNEQVVDYIISKTGKKLLGLANKAGVTPLLLACQMKNYRIVQVYFVH